MSAQELYDALQAAYRKAQQAQVAVREAYSALDCMDPEQETRWYNERICRDSEIDDWYEDEKKRILKKAGF